MAYRLRPFHRKFASLFDLPKVQKFTWVNKTDCTGDDFLRSAVNMGPWTPEQWRSMMWHGGLFAGRFRLFDQISPDLVKADTEIAAYWYEKEPPMAKLDNSSVCFDVKTLGAINKPAGLSLSGTRVSAKLCLEYIAQRLLKWPRLRTINRLDTDTSGVVLFGKNKATLTDISFQFQERTVTKEYLALVYPRPAYDAWSVEGNQTHAQHPSGVVHTFYRFDGTVNSQTQRPVRGPVDKDFGQTNFRVLDTRGDFALVQALPVTGRTHQIRLHLQASGCPIVGDWLYGDGTDPEWPEPSLPMPPREGPGPYSKYRLQLHAHATTVAFRRQRHRIVAKPNKDDGWLFQI